MDGTFSIIKKPFMQMWTIHAFIRYGNEKKMVPLCFVLMSSRTQKDYIRVLGHIKTVILGNRYNYKSCILWLLKASCVRITPPNRVKNIQSIISFKKQLQIQLTLLCVKKSNATNSHNKLMKIIQCLLHTTWKWKKNWRALLCYNASTRLATRQSRQTV
jgi:hypothetical protein